MLLGVRKGGDASLVYGGEVDEKHVHSACPSISLSGGTLYEGVWCFSTEEGGVLLLIPCTIGVRWCVSCRLPVGGVG